MSAIFGSPQFALPQLTRRIDRRSLRVAILLAAIAILNALDLIYTLFAYRIGMLNEVNPLTEVFLQAGLLPSFICFKILMVFCGLGILWKMRYSRLTIPACWVLLLAYSWLGLIWCEWVRTIIRIFEDRLSHPGLSGV